MTENLTKRKERMLEGTWEEIAPHAAEFEGHVLQVIVRSNGTASPAALTNTAEPKNAAEALAPFLEKAKTLRRETPEPHADPYEAAFGDILEEKHRQGRL